MKNYISFLLFCIFALVNQDLRSQSWSWDAATSVKNGQKTLCVDAAGNLYMYGNSYLLNWSGDADTIIRVSNTGQKTVQIVLPPNMAVRSLIAARDTGVYVGGIFSGTLSFANNTYTSQGSSDIWVSRYDKNGALLWMKTVVSSGEDYLSDLCMNASDLILTGSIEDTVNFMGQIVPKSARKELFVGIVNGSGVFQKIKTANAINSSTLDAFSGGQECKVDAAGNIYILAFGAGLNKIDTFRISYFGGYDNKFDRLYCQTLIKFDAGLHPQFVKEVNQCYHFCYPFENLQVSGTGESYLMNLYAYGQSGNDDLWSTIYKYSNTGAALGQYRLRPERNSRITDITLDCFDNLYFTGYSRPYTNYVDPFVYSYAVGRLSSSLTIEWIKQDSLHERFICANSIAVFGKNDLFINGVFEDTVQLLNSLTTGTNGGGFYARINAPGVIACAPTAPSTTGLIEDESTIVALYPNPTTGILKVRSGSTALQAEILSVEGRILARDNLNDEILNISYLRDGLYFVRVVEDGKTVASKKIVLKR